MKILINELSLNGQFESIEHFINNALIQFVESINELDRNKDILLKKQNLWEALITQNTNLHSFLTQNPTVETTLFKSLLRNFGEPYWDISPKHKDSDIYECNGIIVSGSSIAESCERDNIVVSFIQDDFSQNVLQVTKNYYLKISIDNLIRKGDYTEIAYSRGTLNKSNYFARKVDSGKISWVENECRFKKTNQYVKGQPVYQEISTKRYWYLDNFHFPQTHYEVFDTTGKNHLGEADSQGILDYNKADRSKKSIEL